MFMCKFIFVICEIKACWMRSQVKWFWRVTPSSWDLLSDPLSLKNTAWVRPDTLTHVHCPVGSTVIGITAWLDLHTHSDTSAGVSLLERLMNNFPLYQKNDGVFDNHYVTKLLQNYRCGCSSYCMPLIKRNHCLYLSDLFVFGIFRSHPAILKIPNQLYYDGELEACADKIFRNSYCRWQHLPKMVMAPYYPTLIRTALVFSSWSGYEKLSLRNCIWLIMVDYSLSMRLTECQLHHCGEREAQRQGRVAADTRSDKHQNTHTAACCVSLSVDYLMQTFCSHSITKGSADLCQCQQPTLI